jgi:hypothetical protein
VPRARALSFGVVFLVAIEVAARPTRFRFEPTDLRLEPKGVAELDLQVGVTHGEGVAANRVILPDFEFDLGLTPGVKLASPKSATKRAHGASRLECSSATVPDPRRRARHRLRRARMFTTTTRFPAGSVLPTIHPRNLELQPIGIAGFLPGYDGLTVLMRMTSRFELF